MATSCFNRLGRDDQEAKAFGYWLSGFTDGEGCFYLDYRLVNGGYACPGMLFTISQRADDAAILEEIRRFLRCGRVQSKVVVNQHFLNGKDMRQYASKPVFRYEVNDRDSLANLIIPFFDRYPLRSRKRTDFQVWKQGVQLAYEVGLRPKHVRGKAGAAHKWTELEILKFKTICADLRKCRKYLGPNLQQHHKE